MALLQISEPGQSPEPHANEKRRAIGIDLGTTNSLVAVVPHTVEQAFAEQVDSGVEKIQIQTLSDDHGQSLLPSVVRYTQGSCVVGQLAKDAAIEDPLNTIVSVKRLMGRGLHDVKSITADASNAQAGNEFSYSFFERPDGVIAINTAAGPKTAVEVSADILSALAARGRAALGGELDGAVITVPAYFDDAQRQATKDAARLAGLPILRLLNEPTAAAVAYGLDKEEEGVVAIYDLGGGTFDISILRLSKGVFEVLATGGDASLGGDDFDRAIFQWISEQLFLADLSPSQERYLLNLSCELKEALSDAESHTVEYEGQLITLAREQLYVLIDGLIQQTIRVCKRVLRDAKLEKVEVDHIVMVGGSTRGLRIREKVQAFFDQPPLIDIDPDKVVAMGAAIQADILVGNKPDSDLLLLDVLPLSLGLETMGGLVEKVIHRNATIPVVKAQEFTTFKDGQTAMSIHVVQGEREMVNDCRSLAKFDLQGIPPMTAGSAHIRVTFQVDADGLLSVSAKEKSTGVATSVTVKPSYGLDDVSITAMLKASFEHAESDILLRALREQQVEAKRVVESLSVALEENGNLLLNEQEYQQLAAGLEMLKTVGEESDTDRIVQEIDSLNALSQEFANRRMDASIKKALSGHTLDELDEQLK